MMLNPITSFAANKDVYTYYEQMNDQFQEEINDLQCISDRKEFYIAYKELESEYVGQVDPPETIWDCFTEEEIVLIQKVIEGEATAGNFDDKTHVASVILNRLYNETFPDNITDVIYEDSAFSCIEDGRYNKVEITEDTIMALDYVFIFGDTTGGCYWFDNRSDIKTWAKRNTKFVFKDELGHSFYTYKE